MKKLILTFLVCLLLAGTAFAEWHSANQITLRWDAVITIDNGEPLPEGNTALYNVHIKEVKTDATEKVGTDIAELTYVITFNEEGDYYLGVSAIRIIPAVGDIPERRFEESSISWSSEPVNTANNEAFGVSYYIPIGNVGGLRIP